MAKKKQANGIIKNKRALFDYELSDNFLVGIVLNGRETKSLRLGHAQLQGAYINIIGNELYLINSSIHGTKNIPIKEEEVRRNRKLLAKRKEIDQLINAKQQGRAIVPIDILTKGRFIKVKIAVGKGKKAYDKRQTLKKRDDERTVQRNIKNSL